jgi:hypothetical protein
MVASAKKNDPTTILSRAIDPKSGDWPREVARGILSIKISPSDTKRMNALAKLAQAGELSSNQQLEIESYRQATTLLDILKAKAQISLRRSENRV